MRLLLVSVAIARFAAGVDAQPGPTTFVMTCSRARGMTSQGAAVLCARPATDDRFARDETFCALHRGRQRATKGNGRIHAEKDKGTRP
jgi:hypothetical protein